MRIHPRLKSRIMNYGILRYGKWSLLAQKTLNLCQGDGGNSNGKGNGKDPALKSLTRSIAELGTNFDKCSIPNDDEDEDDSSEEEERSSKRSNAALTRQRKKKNCGGS
jgi:hypothetical protein